MSSFNSLSSQVINFIEKNISLKNLKKVFIIYEGTTISKKCNFLFKKEE